MIRPKVDFTSFLFVCLSLFSCHALAVDQRFVYEAETQLRHSIGHAEGDGWVATTGGDSRGHLIYGPYDNSWGEGGAQAVFRMKVDNNTANNEQVVTVDVYDSSTGQTVASRAITRREFNRAHEYQDFSVWFDLRGRNGHTMETRVYWNDVSYVKVDKVTVEVDRFQSGLPRIINKSGASASHVQALVQRAIDGLGFNANQYDSPNSNDLVFVGRYYMAWIDQTGFYGKMNALWSLNGNYGNDLNFVLLDGARPVSAFGVAEDGDGHWLSGYQGAEHFEIPHQVAEPGEDASCEGHLCNWYGVNEADKVTDRDVPHWTVCGENSISFAKKIAPLQLSESGNGLTVVYEAPVTKEGDGDGNADGDFCHADYLFSDGIRRPVYLRVGYVLHGDRNYFDRTYQFYNPWGNPEFGSRAWSVIGGLVLTKYPNGHRLKKDIFNYIRPQNFAMDHAGKHFPAGFWTHYDRWRDDADNMSAGRDDVWAWLKQPFAWSSYGSETMGYAISMAHVGTTDNDDVGFCFCNVHNGLEIGGGVLHRDPSLRIPGGGTSPLAVRRIGLPGSAPLPPPTPTPTATPPPSSLVYQAEGSSMGHNIGRADGDGWSANTAADVRGHMLYGPYATNWGTGRKRAVFRTLVDNVTAGGIVAKIDIYDVTAGQVLAQRDIPRNAFHTAGQYQDITLDFDLTGRQGHKMEARFWWEDISYVKVDYLKIEPR
ncbi:hypothetical protein TDB9533_04455 [Thalassocella blandensis]|nr:hypothetical protein TDB9533_04455 [Thalassocella blandensis]